MPITTKHRYLLPLILFFALVIRSIGLNHYPALNPDEAALGYNAYSILTTARDEHGHFLPLHLLSFGDSKPAGYTYLAIPFVAILGLTPLAVRLPNLIFSILSIYFIYRLVILSTKDRTLALISALILSFNPWHIHFSRGAWEANTALSLVLLATLLVQSRRIFPASIIFVLSTYFYHSARIYAPLLFFYLLYLQLRSRSISFKSLTSPAIICILLAVPVLYSFATSGGASRFSGVGLFADTGPLNRSEELLNQDASTSLDKRLIHNRRVQYLLAWTDKYLWHFNPNFLFVDGDTVPRSKSPEVGQFHLLEFIPLLIGIPALLHISRPFFNLTLFLTLISPLAASLTFQSPSALRALPLVIPLTIFISAGYRQILLVIARYSRPLSTTALVLLSSVWLYFNIYYLDSYFIHQEKRYPFAWNSRFDQAVAYLQDHSASYDHIYFTNHYDQPYILYLFYTKYPPRQIQSQIKLTTPDHFGFSTVRQIDNITFGIPHWDSIPEHSLIIAGNETMPISPASTILFSNQQPGFNIYTK